MLYTFISEGEEDTVCLAQHIAQLATPGGVIVLNGDLGAGKTRFSQAFAKALGVEDIVNSPTFVLIKEYEGRMPLYHMDVYRLSIDEADELGLEEYFFGDGISLVEWGGQIEELLPQERLDITIERMDESKRRFYFEPKQLPYEDWCDYLLRRRVIQKADAFSFKELRK